MHLTFSNQELFSPACNLCGFDKPIVGAPGLWQVRIEELQQSRVLRRRYVFVDEGDSHGIAAVA